MHHLHCVQSYEFWAFPSISLLIFLFWWVILMWEMSQFCDTFYSLFYSYILWLKHCWWHKKVYISCLTRPIIIISIEFYVSLLITVFAIYRLVIIVLWCYINHFQRLKLDYDPLATQTKTGCLICGYWLTRSSTWVVNVHLQPRKSTIS